MKLRKILIIGTLIFSAAYTGCGDDGGGGGGGNSAKPGNPGTPPEPSAPAQRLATRSLGQISAGAEHTCALTAEGGVLCWGKGASGRLGNGGASSNIHYPVPTVPVVNVNGNALTNIVQVSAGGEHTCALTDEGEVFCWGKAGSGRLGNDCNSSCTDKNHAVAVVAEDGSTDSLTGIIQIGMGDAHTCALTDEGKVFCWGAGGGGRLGNNAISNKDHPVPVVSSSDANAPPLTGIVQIDIGDGHACALTAEGTIKCWGEGINGVLGNGIEANSSVPVNVIPNQGGSPLTGIIQVSSGNAFTCALTSSSEVKCWGTGVAGRLGNDDTSKQLYPVSVVDGDGSNTPLTGIIKIETGAAIACALTVGNSVKCWGYGYRGRLGNDDTTVKDHPVAVVRESGSPFALSHIVQVSAGNAHACALTYSGEVLCWGEGGFGQLGNNATDNQTAPVAVVSDSSGTPFHVGLWRREYHCYDDDTCEIDPDSLIRPVLTGAREGTSATPEVEVLGIGRRRERHPPPRRQMPATESIGTGTVATGKDECDHHPDNLSDCQNTTAFMPKSGRSAPRVG